MGICQTERGTQTVYNWMGELLQAGRHEDVTAKSRRMVSQAFTDVDLETMETDTYPWTQSHEAGCREIQSLGVCEYKKRLLAYSQKPYLNQKCYQ